MKITIDDAGSLHRRLIVGDDVIVENCNSFNDQIMVEDLDETSDFKEMLVDLPNLVKKGKIPMFEVSLKNGKRVWVGVQRSGSLMVRFYTEEGVEVEKKEIFFPEKTKVPA